MSQKRIQIYEDSFCTIHECKGSFEVWAKLRGKVIEPDDEKFGLWAWSTFSKERAFMIANELSNGERIVEITFKEVEE